MTRAGIGEYVNMTEETAYLAGIIDGEGTIQISRRPKKNDYRLKASVCSTNEDLVRWVKEKFGGRVYIYGGQNPRWKRGMRVEWSNKEAQRILKMVLSYLIVKKKHAELALRFPGPFSPNRIGVPIWALQRRKELYEQLKELNKRGPRVKEAELEAMLS